MIAALSAQLLITAYKKATHQESTHRKAADKAAGERALVLAELHNSGMSYGEIAKATGLSRSRVQQLVQRSIA